MRINSIRNKLNELKTLILTLISNFHINHIGRSKLDELFLNSKIELDEFKKPCYLDVTVTSRDLLIYVKASLSEKVINTFIQCITTELNIENKKLSIYRSPK